MEIGFIGLGKMGMNMVTRLQRDRHRVASNRPTAVLRGVRCGVHRLPGADTERSIRSVVLVPMLGWLRRRPR